VDGEVDAAVVAYEIVKTFRPIAPADGRLGFLRSLVAPKRTTRTVVDGVTFSIARGEFVSLLGPNGAGKSTMIKMLTGILVPTSGTVRVAGIEPHRHRLRNAGNIGAVFGQRTQLWWHLPARESFAILRDIYEVDDVDYQRRIKEFDELLDLSAFWDTQVRFLSLGQRVRCDLAAALIHDPTILFLDEPTIGMDVVVKEQVRHFLRHQVEQRGRTVLLTTHDMVEVDRLVDRVLLINHGKLVFDGPLDHLRQVFGKTWELHVTLAEAVNDQRVPGLRILYQEGARLVFGPAPGPAQPMTSHEAVRRIVETYAVTELTIEESDLEDVIRLAFRTSGEPPGIDASNAGIAR
jgi:ABC-2 type transport system ATP-binding protein